MPHLPPYHQAMWQDSDPDEDPEEDPEEDQADYIDEEGNGAPFKEDDMWEEEHLALADSSDIPVVDLVPSAGDSEAFETDEIPSPPLPPPPSSLHLPPPVPVSLPLPSLPLPPLPSSLLYHHQSTVREDFFRKNMLLLFYIDTPLRPMLHLRAEEVGYGIRDVWVDPTEAVEEVAPKTLKGVNDRVTELAAVQEQDTQDNYTVIEDGQDRQTQFSQ
ncbi:hypothetical protein Tco_0363625 [Tanacetum coccineum]